MNARPAPTEAIAALVNDITPNWKARSGPCTLADVRDVRRIQHCDHGNPNHTHGTRGAYVNDGCRCDTCRTGAADRARDWLRAKLYKQYAGTWEPRLIDATATHRRIQALACIGWSQNVIADEIGTYRQTIWKILRSRQVTTSTASAIEDYYETHWDKRPPETTKGERNAATKARNHARRMGWHPPMYWRDDEINNPVAPVNANIDPIELDPVAIEEACNGRTVQLTKGERLEAVKILRAKGKSVAEIAELLHVTDRTINRENVEARRGRD